ncbi:MAG: hypothetical protein KDK40_04535, partial [Chlamydiia bacterium]|nr:hypothetical protein [Chlamydiia bacterium]
SSLMHKTGLPYYQKNLLIRRGPYYYAKATGVKHGYTASAGHTLVASACDGERTLIAVLMGFPERNGMFREAKRLFEKAFQEKKQRYLLLDTGAQSFRITIPGAHRELSVKTDERVIGEFYPSERPEILHEVILDPLVRPIKEGQRLGELRLYDSSGPWERSVVIYANESLGRFNLPLDRLFGTSWADLKRSDQLGIVAAAGFILALTTVLATRLRRKFSRRRRR